MISCRERLETLERQRHRLDRERQQHEREHRERMMREREKQDMANKNMRDARARREHKRVNTRQGGSLKPHFYRIICTVLILTLILRITTIVVFNLFYLSIKSLILGAKCALKHQDLQRIDLKSNKYE